jgi:hypothetical protein
MIAELDEAGHHRHTSEPASSSFGAFVLLRLPGLPRASGEGQVTFERICGKIRLGSSSRSQLIDGCPRFPFLMVEERMLS